MSKKDNNHRFDNINEHSMGEMNKVFNLFDENSECFREIIEDPDLHRELKNDVNNRSREYTTIVENYRKAAKTSLVCKNVFKIIIVSVSVCILIAETVLNIVLFLSCRTFEFAQILSIIIPLSISYMTVFISIPKIITSYAFNKEEEKYMSELIQKLSEYDLNILSLDSTNIKKEK